MSRADFMSLFFEVPACDMFWHSLGPLDLNHYIKRVSEKKIFAIRFRCNAAHILLDGWNGHVAGVGRGVWMDGVVTSMGTERAQVGA